MKKPIYRQTAYLPLLLIAYLAVQALAFCFFAIAYKLSLYMLSGAILVVSLMMVVVLVWLSQRRVCQLQDRLHDMEIERDIDSLTKLYNRSAFIRVVDEMFRSGQVETGAVLMMDLDRLKFINDSYGHEYGDAYLITMGKALKQLEEDGGVVSRMAGDEYTAFMPCTTDRASFKDHLTAKLSSFQKNMVDLPEGKCQHLSFSTGFAWYPTDSTDPATLIKYADFAMYGIKHSIKGGVAEFDMPAYEKKQIMLKRVELFENMLAQNEIRYMFQPIMDVHIGGIFAYEMLMRSDTEGLRFPVEILSLAKSESKLYYLEMIGMHKAISVFKNKEVDMYEKMLFVNSIDEVLLSEEDWLELFGRLGRNVSRIAVEIKLPEDQNDTHVLKKTDSVRDKGFSIAVDNFDSSHHSMRFASKLYPEFLKFDMEMVRGIDTDDAKQKKLRRHVARCKNEHILTIAEGVETYEEMAFLKNAGVDYMQGFYIGKPSYELADIDGEIKKAILLA